MLSANDAAILSAIFDPEASNSTDVNISDDAPSFPEIDSTILPELRLQEAASLEPLQTLNPPPATIQSSIDTLSILIAKHQDYASAYLNRAQAIRLLLDASTGTPIFSTQNTPLTTQLFDDLSRTITLCTMSSNSTQVSPLQASLLAKAHTHRGYLLMKAASARKEISCTLPASLANLDSTQLEEMASHDFSLGGRYGNKTARQLSVKTNPYAKACGAIVREALRKEREEYSIYVSE